MMNAQILRLSALCLLLGSQQVPASQALAHDGLPLTSDVAEYFQALSSVDLSSSDFSFADGSGGLSINLEFVGRGLRGDFLSLNADGRGDNTSGNPEGQIVAYNLSRIFGYSQSYGRGSWVELKGPAVEVLHRLAAQNTKSHKNVRESRARVLETTQSSDTIQGTMSIYGPKPYDLTILEDTRMSPNGQLRTSNTFTALIRAEGPRPQNRLVTLGRFPMNELETARTLSTIFVIDALTEQWDRFSGGNISVVKSGELYRMVSYDNGGAGISGWGTGYVTRYLQSTTRFDRSVAANVLALDAFVSGRSPQFLNFTNVPDFERALGLRKFNKGFKRSLAKVAAHIRRVLAARGEAAYF